MRIALLFVLCSVGCLHSQPKLPKVTEPFSWSRADVPVKLLSFYVCCTESGRERSIGGFYAHGESIDDAIAGAKLMFEQVVGYTEQPNCQAKKCCAEKCVPWLFEDGETF